MFCYCWLCFLHMKWSEQRREKRDSFGRVMTALGLNCLWRERSSGMRKGVTECGKNDYDGVNLFSRINLILEVDPRGPAYQASSFRRPLVLPVPLHDLEAGWLEKLKVLRPRTTYFSPPFLIPDVATVSPRLFFCVYQGGRRRVHVRRRERRGGHVGVQDIRHQQVSTFTVGLAGDCVFDPRKCA